MRFAIAVGVLVQTLPVTSDVNDLLATLAGNLHKVEQSSIHSLVQRGRSDSKSNILNAIRRKNGRKPGASWLNQRVQHNEALKNAPQDESEVVECDPKKGADVGVLSCGPGKYCMESESSGLGGVCNKESALSGPRLLRGFNTSTYDVDFYYQSFCNESSSYFDYACDCEEFDGESLVGTIECQIYENECLVPDCNDTCISASVSFISEELYYGTSTCINVVSPDGEVESGCYGFTKTSADDSYMCTASWDGVDCICTVGDLYLPCGATIDCPGDGPSEICLENLLDQFTALAGCFPDVYGCQLCVANETTLDPYANLTLPGVGNVSCAVVDFEATSGSLNSTECSLAQTLARSECCIGEDVEPGSKAPFTPAPSMATGVGGSTSKGKGSKKTKKQEKPSMATGVGGSTSKGKGSNFSKKEKKG